MPQTFPEQILQRMVRLSADGNSQGEVARTLGVSQGCISKILRHNWETGRPHQRKRGGSMKISTPMEDHQLLRMVRTNCYISTLRLRMQRIRPFGRRMSVRTIRRQLLATRYWSQRPARCSRLTLEHRRRRREWGRRHTVRDLRQRRHCIFCDESRFSLYHSDGRVRVRRRQRERQIDACISSLMMEIMARQSWYGVQPAGGTWTQQLSMCGIKCQSGSETWMTPPPPPLPT